MSKKKTTSQYIKEVNEINPNIEVLGEYIKNNQKIYHHCRICGYKWLAIPTNISKGCGCPKCGELKSKNKLRKTHGEYIEQLKTINDSIELLQKYININTPILHRCKKCNYQWYKSPSKFLNGQGRPVCSGKVIGNAPYYTNSI